MWSHCIIRAADVYLCVRLQPVLSWSQSGGQNTGGRWTTKTTRPSPEPSTHCSTLRRWDGSQIALPKSESSSSLNLFAGEGLWRWRLWSPLLSGSYSEISGELKLKQMSSERAFAAHRGCFTWENGFLNKYDHCSFFLCTVVAALWVEELSISGFAEPNPERHHRIRTAGGISALCTLGLSGQITGN